VASRSERRTRERARAAAAAAAAAPPTSPPTTAQAQNPTPSPPKPAVKLDFDDDDDDDDDDDKIKYPVDPVDNDDDDDIDDDNDDFGIPPSKLSQQQQQQQQQQHINPDDPENWKDLEVTTNLWRVVSQGDIQQLGDMIRSNAIVTRLRSADGRGALFWAYEYGHPDIVKLLVSAGAREDVRDKDGKLPREMAGSAPPKQSAATPAAPAPRRADEFTSCNPCVANGFGWETTTQRCSSTSTNRICPDESDDEDDDDDDDDNDIEA